MVGEGGLEVYAAGEEIRFRSPASPALRRGGGFYAKLLSSDGPEYEWIAVTVNETTGTYHADAKGLSSLGADIGSKSARPARHARGLTAFSYDGAPVWMRAIEEQEEASAESKRTGVTQYRFTSIGPDSFPARITGGSGGIYTADFHELGKDADPTASGTIEVLSLSPTTSLPVGTWVVATRAAVQITGGDV